ncbi:MAG: type II toxin-antitoxin system HicA family toxin [Ignavibacterium sp.]|nr:type II toxin-antitoxin system HicA family toxin [Ignavibacterium sp.]
MTRKQKLFEKIKNNPKNVRFSELKQLLLDENFILDRISGSHHIFKREDIIFVIPMHKDLVKSVYVKRVIELIESIRSKK